MHRRNPAGSSHPEIKSHLHGKQRKSVFGKMLHVTILHSFDRIHGMLFFHGFF